MTGATSSTRNPVRGIALVLLVLLALVATLFASPQQARADGVISGVTEDRAGAPISVAIALYTRPAGDFVDFTVSDSGTGAFSFASAPDGDYRLTTSTSSGFVETTVDITVTGGAVDVGTISLYRFGTVSGTILNFSVVQQTMQIWVDQWTGTGWSTVSTSLAAPTGSDNHAYVAANAIPGPGYYRVTFDPDAGDAFLRTYSGDYAEHFPAGDPSIAGITGVFQATGYEQSFTGIDVTLALPPAPPGGGGGGGSSSGPGSGGGGAPSGGGAMIAAPASEGEPTAEPTPTTTATAAPQPVGQPQATPVPTTTAAAPAGQPGEVPGGLWLFIVLGVVAVLAVGVIGWLLFRRR